MSTLEKALIIAAQAHSGQKQRNGDPYILHPLRIMHQLNTESEKIAAVLHDVIEDSDLTLSDLQNEGFSEDIIHIVDLLTHYEKDSYTEYIDRLKDHPVARKIKLIDLQDNMDIQRLNSINEKDFKRLERYHKHWLKLLAETNNE